jgi:predicted peptidase
MGMLPEFRGPNCSDNPRCTEACGSKLAKQDIVDAVNYVSKNYNINTDKIFLLGGSGGGHMALMTGSYRPDIWLAVSAWCSITDLQLWHEQLSNVNSQKTLRLAVAEYQNIVMR